MKLARTCWFVLVVSLSALWWPAHPVQAQERDRVYLRFVGDHTQQLEALALLFEGAVLSAGVVEFAGTAEMDSVYAECRAQIGVAASEERSCRLQAARRMFVGELLEVSAARTDDDRVRLGLAVWNTNDNTKVYGALVTVEAKKLDQGLESGLPELAERYLCFRGVARHCDGALATTSPAAGDAATGPGPVETVTGHAGRTPPTSIGEAAMSSEARRVTFLPHDDGHWTLHDQNNATVCALPCTRWVAPRSGAFVVGLDGNGDAMSRIDVPNQLGWHPEQPLQAAPDLDSDWQTWEVTSVAMIGGGFVVTMVGMGVLLAGLDGVENDSTLTAVGGTIFGIGSLAFSMVGPIYAFYHWVKSDGRDHLIIEKAVPTEPVETGHLLGVGFTF